MLTDFQHFSPSESATIYNKLIIKDLSKSWTYYYNTLWNTSHLSQ